MLASVVVVPCYNEEKRLKTGEFRAFVAENPKTAFLFVNDGNTDGTRDLLDELNREDSDSFMVLHLERNCGKAEAVRRGMREASRLQPIYAGYWDADLATPLVAPPDSIAEYSDIGFIVLGEFLEHLGGISLDVFAQKEIFAPLGMARTCFNPAADCTSEIPPTEDDRNFRHRVIQGEVNDENAWVMGGVSGHAGLFAPATDVARFAECMLRGGAPILNTATVELFTRRLPRPPNTSRALGWDTPSQPSSSGAHFSSRSFGHLGYTGTSLWIDPVRQLSVTLLTNRTWPNRSSQAIKQVRPRLHDTIVEAL